MRHIWLHQVLIVAIAAVVMFTKLGGTRLWDRDETRNARCTVEMLERDDWVVPYYNGEVRSIKPVGMYWMMMSATALFGPNEFAFRFWSAIAGVGTSLLTYHIGRRLFNETIGLWAGIILATSLMFTVLSRTTKVDAMLIFMVTAATAVYVMATFKRKESVDGEAIELSGPQLRHDGCYYPQSRLAVVAMFALMGLAVLGKGPIGFILPTAVIGMFLLIQRLPTRESDEFASDWWQPALRPRLGSIALTVGWLCFAVLLTTKVSWEFGIVLLVLLGVHLLKRPLSIFRPFAPLHFLKTCWSMRPVTAIVTLAVVALPWHIWVAIRDIRWIEGFYLDNNLGRAAAAMENHSGSDLLYYPIAVALGFAPWSMFLAPMLIEAVRRARVGDAWRTGHTFLLCWVGVYLGLFSLAATKLPNYVVPCYPALALLAANYIFHLRRSTLLSAEWWPRVSMACLIATGVGLAIGLPIAAHIYLPGDEWLGVVGVLPIAAALLFLYLWRRERAQAATVSYAGFAIVFVVTLLVGVAERVDRHQRIHELAEVALRREANPEVAAYRCLEPSWVHYIGRNLPEFCEPDGGDVNEFFEADPRRLIITTSDHWNDLQSKLPSDVRVLAECPQFLKHNRLLLIGREPAAAITAKAGDGADDPLRR